MFLFGLMFPLHNVLFCSGIYERFLHIIISGKNTPELSGQFLTLLFLFYCMKMERRSGDVPAFSAADQAFTIYV
ncbi:hypothetical protein B5F37_01535 [Drancourtella sp. An210]|nr:hypothetical protein B5F37_01535 [Drancourtella sp. An210]